MISLTSVFGSSPGAQFFGRQFAAEHKTFQKMGFAWQNAKSKIWHIFHDVR
jgi:hypothetical protein